MGSYHEMMARKEAALDAVGGPERFFNYNSETGVITWKPRGDKSWDAKYAGKIAGGLSVHGYVRTEITIDGKKIALAAHRLAFRIYHGRWPAPGLVVHHKNAIKSDNRIANLEEVTQRKNTREKYGETLVVRCSRSKSFVAHARWRTTDRAKAEEIQAELNAVIDRHYALENKTVAE